MSKQVNIDKELASLGLRLSSDLLKWLERKNAFDKTDLQPLEIANVVTQLFVKHANKVVWLVNEQHEKEHEVQVPSVRCHHPLEDTAFDEEEA